MKLTEKEFNWIVEYMHNRYGIELGHKRVLIEGRLENYRANIGMLVEKIRIEVTEVNNGTHYVN